MNEQQLIKGCCENDIRCQKALYDKLHPKMLGICMRYAENRDEAQDMLQEGFIKVFKGIKTYKGEGSFVGWVRRIIVNTALEEIRRKKNNLKTLFEDESLMLVDYRESAEEQLQADDILKTIQSLPAGYRMVFNLFAIEGYSHDEIAQKLDISVNTSYSQYHRAKMLLQKLILREKKTMNKTA